MCTLPQAWGTRPSLVKGASKQNKKQLFFNICCYVFCKLYVFSSVSMQNFQQVLHGFIDWFCEKYKRPLLSFKGCRDVFDYLIEKCLWLISTAKKASFIIQRLHLAHRHLYYCSLLHNPCCYFLQHWRLISFWFCSILLISIYQKTITLRIKWLLYVKCLVT